MNLEFVFSRKVHELGLWTQWTTRAGRSTVDSDSRLQVSSSELPLPGGSGRGGSTGWLQHEEGPVGNLTEGFTSRLDGEARLTAVESIRWWWSSVDKLLSSGWTDLSREMRLGNVLGPLGVLYIGRGDEVRGRGRKSGGRRWVFNTSRFETEKEREGRCLGAACWGERRRHRRCFASSTSEHGRASHGGTWRSGTGWGGGGSGVVRGRWRPRVGRFGPNRPSGAGRLREFPRKWPELSRWIKPN
jgi:hypothetical protein